METTFNVRLSHKTETQPENKIKAVKIQTSPKVDITETVVQAKPNESLPTSESTEISKSSRSMCPPKWMSASQKNSTAAEESIKSETKNTEKLNLTNKLNSVIENGAFEKAPEVVEESPREEDVKAKSKWKRPGASDSVQKAKTTVPNKSVGNVTNASTPLTVVAKDACAEVQLKKDAPKSTTIPTPNKDVKDVQNKTSLESKSQIEEQKDAKPKPKWKRPTAETKTSPETAKKVNLPSKKPQESKSSPDVKDKSEETAAKINAGTSKKETTTSKSRGSESKEPTTSMTSEKPKISSTNPKDGKIETKAPLPTKSNAPSLISPGTNTAPKSKGSDLHSSTIPSEQKEVSNGSNAKSTADSLGKAQEGKKLKESKSELCSKNETEKKLEKITTSNESKPIAVVETKDEEEQPSAKSIENTDSNTKDEEQKEEQKKEEEEEEEEDASGMRAMRKEVGSKMENMEAEFAAGASKIAALRAKMKRMREAAKANREAESRGS